MNELLCPKCAKPLSRESVLVFDVDGSDQCEDGRFGPPTYSLVIRCLECRYEIFREDDGVSSYGDHELPAAGPLTRLRPIT